MANIIRFSDGTDAVLTTATQLESLSDDFFRVYTQLYTLIESDIAISWKGDDYDAFRQITEGERHVFDSMREVINEYASFLRSAANAHNARMQDSRSASSHVTF